MGNTDAEIARLAAIYLYRLHRWAQVLEDYERGAGDGTLDIAYAGDLAQERDEAEAALAQAVYSRPDLCGAVWGVV